jgi:iron complex transport system substrate-binding protein
LKILVTGSGGREHAIIRALKKNPGVEKIYALPGNGGIARDAACVPIKATDIDKVTAFAKENAIDYAVVAPDDPLVLGLVDRLEELGIPVFIDTSSRESHPMGRTEWVRLYGVLTGQEAEAEAFWNEQKEQFAKAESYEDTGLTVAYFSISSSGNVVVRASEDYIPQMIRLAGGEYIFKDLVAESGYNSSVRLSMEEFYNTAQDADFLIYNATIESPVQNIDELCAMSSLLSDFKAVQEGNVWQVEKSLYQSPDIAALMITDLRKMLTGDSTEEMTFLQQLK